MKLRKTHAIMQMLLSVLIVCGCVNSQHIKNEVEILKDEIISLDLDSMQKGLDFIASKREAAIQKSYTYIKYINSIQCSSCMVKNLRSWIHMQDVFDSCNDLSLIFIISPKDYQTKRIIDELRNDTIMLENVYLDTLGVFERANPFLPTNPFLQSFMIDSNGKVLIVGDPTYDEIVEGEFRNFIHNKFNVLDE